MPKQRTPRAISPTTREIGVTVVAVLICPSGFVGALIWFTRSAPTLAARVVRNVALLVRIDMSELYAPLVGGITCAGNIRGIAPPKPICAYIIFLVLPRTAPTLAARIVRNVAMLVRTDIAPFCAPLVIVIICAGRIGGIAPPIPI